MNKICYTIFIGWKTNFCMTHRFLLADFVSDIIGGQLCRSSDIPLTSQFHTWQTRELLKNCILHGPTQTTVCKWVSKHLWCAQKPAELRDCNPGILNHGRFHQSWSRKHWDKQNTKPSGNFLQVTYSDNIQSREGFSEQWNALSATSIHTAQQSPRS